MSRLQATLCRSAPWRLASGRVVLPWSLQGIEPRGKVLEVGAGSGAMAAAVLERHADVTMTVTDYDEQMVAAASDRLAVFGDRVSVRPADATALPFADGSFDTVLGWVMLHHTVEWERALAEAVRVVRPGGHLVGYDLLSSTPMRLIHRGDDHRVRTMSMRELRVVVSGLPVDHARVRTGLAGSVARFVLRKRA